jgi:hypothetical protein
VTNAGSLYVHNNITNNGATGYNDGTLLLTGNVLQVLDGSAVFNTTNVVFNNNAGIYLKRRYSVADQAVFISGIVNAPIVTEPLEFNPGGSAIAVAGASDTSHVNGYIFQKGTGSFVYPSGDSAKYQPIAAHLSTNSDGMQCRYYPADAGNAPFLTTGLSNAPLHYYNNQEYWDLHPQGTATGTVTVYYDNYRGTAINPGFDTVLKAAHKVAAGWNNEGGIVSGTQNYGTVTTDGSISNWSPFTLGSNYYLFNLPVELSSFTARTHNCDVVLSWTTETEENLLAFDVEYSSDGVVFTKLGSVTPKGSHSEYSFTCSPPRGRAYYRLRLRDVDGAYNYSMVLTANMNCSEHNIAVYPNPVASGEDLHVTLAGYNGSAWGVLYDITGRLLSSTVLTNGHNIVHTDLLSAGNYELAIISNEAGREVYKIVVYR